MDTSWISFSAVNWTFGDAVCACLASLKDRPGNAGSFADLIATRFEIPHVLPTNLGRTAICLGLKALGFGRGEGVIVPTLVCPTVVQAILRAGCRPILADVERDLHVSVSTLEAVRNSAARAVLVPHLYGLSARIEEIKPWAKAFGLIVIDDAAQGVGLKRHGRYLGTQGDIGIFSFGPFKNIGAIRGGALVSWSEAIISRAAAVPLASETAWIVCRRALSASLKLRWRSAFLKLRSWQSGREGIPAVLGGGKRKQGISGDEAFRFMPFDQSLAGHAVERAAETFRKRTESSNWLWDRIRGLDGLSYLGNQDGPYVKIPIRLGNGLTSDKAVRFLRSLRIEAELIYRPAHLISAFSGFAPGPLPTGESCWQQTLVIPNPLMRSAGVLGRLADALAKLSALQ